MVVSSCEQPNGFGRLEAVEPDGQLIGAIERAGG